MNSIFETSIAYWRSSVLFEALKINLFEKLGENSLTAEEIAQICRTDLRFVKRLLRALAAMKLIRRENNTYTCTEDALDGLIPGRSRNMSHFARAMGEDFSSGIWVDIPEKLEKGSFSSYSLVEERQMNPQTLAMVTQNIALQGEAIALKENLDLSETSSLLDIGGGSGVYSIALCKSNPLLQAVIIDIPEVAALTKKIVAEYELDDRIQVVGMDWNDCKYENEFDCVLLSDVLYFQSEECKKLINLAFRTLKPGGLLVVRGYFLDESDERIFPALFDINLLVHNTANMNPSVDEVVSWIDECGFEECDSKPLTELSYLITGKKPLPEKEKS